MGPGWRLWLYTAANGRSKAGCNEFGVREEHKE